VVPWCVREGRRKLGLGASRVALLFLSVCGELYLYSICQAGQLDTLELLPVKRMLLFFFGSPGYPHLNYTDRVFSKPNAITSNFVRGKKRCW